MKEIQDDMRQIKKDQGRRDSGEVRPSGRTLGEKAYRHESEKVKGIATDINNMGGKIGREPLSTHGGLGPGGQPFRSPSQPGRLQASPGLSRPLQAPEASNANLCVCIHYLNIL